MARDILISRLKDAYAMEQSQIKMLDRFIDDFNDHENIKEMLERHLEETEDQADRVKECLENMGESTSKTKSILGNIMGSMQGMSTGPFEDELVRNMVMLHAGEHFEHASYLALSEIAKNLGEDEIARMCEDIAAQEKAVADWSIEQLPTVVDAVLAQKVRA